MKHPKTAAITTVLCERHVFVSAAEARRAIFKGAVKVNGLVTNDILKRIQTGDFIEVHNRYAQIVNLDTKSGRSPLSCFLGLQLDAEARASCRLDRDCTQSEEDVKK